MTDSNVQKSIWLPEDLARWWRIEAAVRGITQSQLVIDLLEAERQREEGR